MVLPEVSFGAHHIFAIDVERTINLDGFGEIVAALGDLINDGSIGCVEIISCRRDIDEIVGIQLLEDSILLVPGPIDGEKPEP